MWLGGGAEYHARPILSHSDPHFQVREKIQLSIHNLHLQTLYSCIYDVRRGPSWLASLTCGAALTTGAPTLTPGVAWDSVTRGGEGSVPFPRGGKHLEQLVHKPFAFLVNLCALVLVLVMCTGYLLKHSKVNLSNQNMMSQHPHALILHGVLHGVLKNSYLNS